MPSGIKTKDIMRSHVVSVKTTQTALDAAKIMRKEDVGSVIVTEGKKPIGIVTREDMATKVVAKDMQPSKIIVKKIMNSPLISCSPEDDIVDVAKLMNKYRYDQLPVISLNKLVGIITIREILKTTPDLIELFKERLEEPSLEASPEMLEGGECERCGNFSEELTKINDQWICSDCMEEEELA